MVLENWKNQLKIILLTDAKWSLDCSPMGSGKSHSIGEWRDAEILKKPEGVKGIDDLVNRDEEMGIENDSLFNVRYIDSNYLNPSCETLAEWNQESARSYGLIYNEKTNRFRRAKKEDLEAIGFNINSYFEGVKNRQRERYEHEIRKLRDHPHADESWWSPPNCANIEAFDIVQQSGRSFDYSGDENKLNPICRACTFLETCPTHERFYLHQKNRSQLHEFSRIHPKSLLPKDNSILSYKNAIGVIEESGTFNVLENQEIHGSCALANYTQSLANYTKLKITEVFSDDLLDFLERLIAIIIHGGYTEKDTDNFKKLEGKEAHYGLHASHRLLQFEPSNRCILTDSIRAQFDDEIRSLISINGIDAICKKKIEDIANMRCWMDVIDIAQRRINGALTIVPDGDGKYFLRITKRNNQLIDNIKSFAKILMLDATPNLEYLRKKFDIRDEKIKVFSRKIETSKNIEFFQITGLGDLGMQRRDNLQNRINRTIDAIKNKHKNQKVGVLDFLKFIDLNDSDSGYWGVDSRGSNKFKNHDVLIICGRLNLNLSDLITEFSILWKRPVNVQKTRVKIPLKKINGKVIFRFREFFNDPEFNAFCQYKTNCEIVQATGRLRADRRPDSHLKVYFISDFPSPFYVKLLDVSDVCADLSPNWLKNVNNVLKIASKLMQKNQPITATAIAKNRYCKLKNRQIDYIIDKLLQNDSSIPKSILEKYENLRIHLSDRRLERLDRNDNEFDREIAQFLHNKEAI
ncbi:MAG: hypothetical protein AB4290_24970 [Spirulina sp.]